MEPELYSLIILAFLFAVVVLYLYQRDVSIGLPIRPKQKTLSLPKFKLGPILARMTLSDMKMPMGEHKEVYICPILGKTVIFENEHCNKNCNVKNCPIIELKEITGGVNERSIHSGQRRK